MFVLILFVTRATPPLSHETVHRALPRNTLEPMPGFEPGTSSLPRKCSTTELHRHIVAWAVMDSNHRRLTPAELQSAPFGHSGNCPFRVVCSYRQHPLDASERWMASQTGCKYTNYFGNTKTFGRLLSQRMLYRWGGIVSWRVVRRRQSVDGVPTAPTSFDCYTQTTDHSPLLV